MIVETHDLTKTFRRHEAVHGVNLSVPEGATCALIGANGAGKSTTLRMLVNILAPDQGHARVLGIDSRKLGPDDRRRIGYLAENQAVPDRLSVAHYFEYLRVMYPSWDRALEQHLRKQFDLPPERLLGKLSHGMRMKALLIGALAFRPKLLILDEPLSGLDPLARDEIMSGLLAEADDTTLLISSHELAEIESCTTHVAFMAKGRLVFQDTIEALTARFREITVTAAQTVVPQQWPASWLNPQFEGSFLRFVDAAFVDEPRLYDAVQMQLGAPRRLEATPLSLRDISKALLRATRQEV